MGKPKIKSAAKTPTAAELAGWPMERVEAEYQRLMDEWMERSNSGQRQTWRKFEEMDVFFLEMQRRKYGPGAVVQAKQELADFKMGLVPKGD